MNFYEDKVLPHIIGCACSLGPIMKERTKVVPLAYGDVLEVGMGSGLNLALYDTQKVNKVWGLEPSKGMRVQAEKNLKDSPVHVEWLDLPGEKIPLDDESVDSIVLTFTLCTIPDWQSALKQMHRVLKPNGTLFFCEHGQAPDDNVQRWQDRLNPMWKTVMGGCHLNRPVIENISNHGFEITSQHSHYLKNSPRFASYISRGQATKHN